MPAAFAEVAPGDSRRLEVVGKLYGPALSRAHQAGPDEIPAA
jgi:hypothetical protein